MAEISPSSQTDSRTPGYCTYYQARVKDGDATLLVGVLKNVGHVCFDRTLENETGLFEFFVPRDQNDLFLAIMADFEAMGSVTGLTELPNRLLDPAQHV